MKASELASVNHFHGLIYGDAGNGKTCLACQFPGPIEYWDFDGKISSAVRYLPALGKAAQLDQIDVYQFGSLPSLERIAAWEKRSQLIDAAVKAKQPLPFKTLVLDSLTSFSHYIMEDYIFRSQPGIKRALVGVNALQDYQLYDKHMTRILTGLLSLPCHVVVLAHVDTQKDESTGMIKHQPLAAGQKIISKLPAWFEEVYVARADKDGKRTLQTQPGDNYVARGQRGLDKFIPLDINLLIK
jgi:hypothetical protein